MAPNIRQLHPSQPQLTDWVGADELALSSREEMFCNLFLTIEKGGINKVKLSNPAFPIICYHLLCGVYHYINKVDSRWVNSLFSLINLTFDV